MWEIGYADAGQSARLFPYKTRESENVKRRFRDLERAQSLVQLIAMPAGMPIQTRTVRIANVRFWAIADIRDRP